MAIGVRDRVAHPKNKVDMKPLRTLSAVLVTSIKQYMINDRINLFGTFCKAKGAPGYQAPFARYLGMKGIISPTLETLEHEWGIFLEKDMENYVD